MKRYEARIWFDAEVLSSAVIFKDEDGESIDKESLTGIQIGDVWVDWTDLSRDARKRLLDMLEKKTCVDDYVND